MRWEFWKPPEFDPGEDGKTVWPGELVEASQEFYCSRCGKLWGGKRAPATLYSALTASHIDGITEIKHVYGLCAECEQN